MKLITLMFLTFTMKAQAQEITIVDVRRNITLSETDSVYKDFYINAGPASGLKKNLVVTAVRKINIRDASGANAVGEILVPVGQLKVIAVYDKVAVAREYQLLERDELPMLEQIGIMTGDRIEVKGSFIDDSKPKKKRNVAQDESVTPASSGASATTLTAVVVTNPVVSANANAEKVLAPAAQGPAPTANAESLEKTADSGQNTQHE